MRRALLLLLLILPALALALPWYAGIQAEAHYARLLRSLERQGFALAENRYRRGWFASEAVSVLALGDPALSKAPRLRLSSRIRHGPLDLDALLEGHAASMAARAETGLALLRDDHATPLPTRLSTWVGLDGAARVGFLPSAAPSDGLPELRGEINLDAESGRIAGHLAVSPFRYRDATDLSLVQGASRIEIDSVRGAAGLRLGDTRLEVESLRLQTAEHDLSLEGLTLSTRAGAEQGRVWTRADYAVRRIDYAGERLERLTLALRLDGLSAAVLGRLAGSLDELTATRVGEAEKAFALFGLVLGNLNRLLEGGPRLSLERLRLDTPDGQVDARLEMAFAGLPADRLLDPRGWLESLSAEGRLALPESLLQRLLSRQAAQSGAGDGQSGLRARERIDTLLRQELAVRDDKLLRTRFRLSAGLLNVNGKTFALP